MARAPCTAFAGVMLLPLLATLALTASPAVVAQDCPAPPQQPDYTAQLNSLLGGQVVQPPSPFNVTVWKGDATQPGFVFPELSDGEFGIPNLQAKGSFGIGVSGGGLRATSLAIGWLRGMQRLGLLRKARYLGSASGGSIANVMVSFTDPNLLSAKFGTYYPPGSASVDRLKNHGKQTFGYVLSHMNPNFYQTFIEVWSPLSLSFNANSESAFARAISVMLLNPLGLGLWNSTVTVRGTRGEVHRKVASVAQQLNLSVYSLPSGSPFPLITGNILDSTEDMMFYPFEMTPLYSGAPCNFSNYTASAAKGGGLVEPLGFNAQLTQPPAQPLPVGVPQNVSVTSRYVQPLAGRVAVSGGILAVEAQKIIRAAPGMGTMASAFAGQPFYEIFNFEDYSSLLYPFGDGGYTDNQGLIAMLRRKVKKILLFYAIADPTTDKDRWSAANTGLSMPFGRCVNCYTYLSPDLTDELINTASRVFEEQDEFDRMFLEYQENVCNGTVNTFRANLTVRENAFLGVPGGWQVELLVVMNAVVRQWEDQLHDSTKTLLNMSRTDPTTIAEARLHPLQTHELVDFPFFNILTFNYDGLAVGALSNFATWQVMQLEQQLRDFVASASA